MIHTLLYLVYLLFHCPDVNVLLDHCSDYVVVDAAAVDDDVDDADVAVVHTPSSLLVTYFYSVVVHDSMTADLLVVDYYVMILTFLESIDSVKKEHYSTEENRMDRKRMSDHQKRNENDHDDVDAVDHLHVNVHL